jgi:sugar phosphate isomerase/epimerase
VFAAASTECYRDLPLLDALEKLGDLEYSSVVIALHEDGNQLKPSQVLENVEKAASLCRDTHRLNIVGYNIQVSATGEEGYEQFAACCRLAKATKVVSLTVPSAELGTPFNEEVEHLRRLVAIATLEGALVSIKTQTGRLSQDPDTVVVLCDNVKGLGVTLDPSHFIYGPHRGRGFEQLLKYVYHVQLRDTRKDELQVRVGQGEMEYGKLVSQLRRVGYDRCLEVNMTEMPGVDQASELRKLRLLLESLL